MKIFDYPYIYNNNIKKCVLFFVIIYLLIVMITAESQVDFFLSYYSYDIIHFFNSLKTKYENDNLLNKCDKNSTSDFINLL